MTGSLNVVFFNGRKAVVQVPIVKTFESYESLVQKAVGRKFVALL
jgi:hypothetical protein